MPHRHVLYLCKLSHIGPRCASPAFTTLPPLNQLMSGIYSDLGDHPRFIELYRVIYAYVLGKQLQVVCLPI